MNQEIQENEKWKPTDNEIELLSEFIEKLDSVIGELFEGHNKLSAISALISVLFYSIDSQLEDVRNIVVIKNFINKSLENLIKEREEKH